MSEQASQRINDQYRCTHRTEIEWSICWCFCKLRDEKLPMRECKSCQKREEYAEGEIIEYRTVGRIGISW